VSKKSRFPVGYGKPPHHTRFKPGQSGNPGGRPKKKANTFAETLEMELNTLITVTEGGKQRKITMRQAIVKQQMNKAIQGDPRATALVMKVPESRKPDPKEPLLPFLQWMRANDAKHEFADPNGNRATEASDLPDNRANDRVDDDHD
jgi:hypothetical protein